MSPRFCCCGGCNERCVFGGTDDFLVCVILRSIALSVSRAPMRTAGVLVFVLTLVLAIVVVIIIIIVIIVVVIIIVVSDEGNTDSTVSGRHDMETHIGRSGR